MLAGRPHEAAGNGSPRAINWRTTTGVGHRRPTVAWRDTGMHSDYLRVEHEIMVCLPAGPGWTADLGRRAGGPSVRLLFFRESGPDFSERDRALLTLLHPHLHQAYLDAERRRRGTPQLTLRHWEVLQLVAAGHTNAQIARRLGVTEETVRKHLENIYARLHVSSRTAAVTRALPGPGHLGTE